MEANVSSRVLLAESGARTLPTPPYAPGKPALQPSGWGHRFSVKRPEKGPPVYSPGSLRQRPLREEVD